MVDVFVSLCMSMYVCLLVCLHVFMSTYYIHILVACVPTHKHRDSTTGNNVCVSFCILGYLRVCLCAYEKADINEPR